MKYISKTYKSPFSDLTFTSDGENITTLEFGNPDELYKNIKQDDLPIFDMTKKWLDLYFSSCVPDFTPPLLPSGSVFQKRVWDILLKVPYGEVSTYGEIAKELGKESNQKMSAQAVGGALSKNPIAIIIPCHRIVGTGNNLTGYAGGLDIKIKLLKTENVDITKFKLPK